MKKPAIKHHPANGGSKHPAPHVPRIMQDHNLAPNGKPSDNPVPGQPFDADGCIVGPNC